MGVNKYHTYLALIDGARIHRLYPLQRCKAPQKGVFCVWHICWWSFHPGVLGSVSTFSQRFGRYVLWPSSGVCRTREPSRNFELRPLLNPQGSPVLIPLAITGYKCTGSILTADELQYRILNTCSRLWLTESEQFREGSRVRQTPEEGRRTYRPKRCGNNNIDEDNSPKTLNDENPQASSQKFRQQIFIDFFESLKKLDKLWLSALNSETSIQHSMYVSWL